MTIEVRHLRGFLMIADERNITRAAERLHLSQPALSRSLSKMESELGVQLVDRSTHHLGLTDAGRRFERAARDAVRAFDDALATAGNAVAPLRIGQSWSAAAHLSPIVRAWKLAHPDRPITVLRGEDRTAGLANGKVDVALTRGPMPDDGYRSVIIDEEARVAVLPADHPLARRRALRLADLAEGALVVQTRAGTTSPLLWPEGSRPRIAANVTSMDDWLVAIASGAGFGVSVASTAALHQHPDVRYVALTDAPPVPLLVAWPRRGEHPWVREFVRLARHVAESGPPAPAS
jgi:DNA-binding transcriptional LysR family regulator